MSCIHGAGAACIPCAQACKLHGARACSYCSRQALAAQVTSVYAPRKKTIGRDASAGFKGRSFRTPLYEKGIR